MWCSAGMSEFPTTTAPQETTTPAPEATTAEATATPASQADQRRPLTTADRCDLCGAQAFVRVVLASGELLFCGHHARAHADALTAQALFIQDETEHILTA